MTPWTRRRALLAGTSILGGLAGCTSADDSATPTQTPGSDTADGDVGGDMSDDLDLREANVVGVEYERQGERVSFDVTLHHDDDGEDGYADWWQVESLQGEQLGRRVLTHAHSRQPFTRSDTFEISSDTTCVVVRGHDQTHGYGGQAVVLNLDTGAMRTVDQGTDSQSFTRDDCP